MRRGVLSPCVLGLMAFASGREVQAIGSCWCPGIGFVVPGSGGRVPLNARLFATMPGHDPGSARLRCGERTEIPVDVSPAGGEAHRVWIQPKSRLPADTPCILTFARRTEGLIADGGAWLPATTSHTFFTGDRVDGNPPTVEQARLVQSEQPFGCESASPGANLVVKGFRDDVASGGSASVLVQIDVTGPGGTQRLFAAAGHGGKAELTGVFLTAAPFDVAQNNGNDCARDTRLGDPSPGATYSADVTFWDWAGNSTVVRGLSFTLSSPEASRAGGCVMARADGDPAGLAFAVLALVALACRRSGRSWR